MLQNSAVARILLLRGGRIKARRVISGAVFRGGPEPTATPWIESALGAGKLIRTLVVPAGMSTEEARRIVDRKN